MKPNHVIRVVSTVMLASVAVTAQTAQENAVPLKNWTTPLYWQPNQAERETNSKSGTQIQFSPNAISNTALVFVAVSPCRLVDTRGFSSGFSGSTPFNGPYIQAGQTATFPIQSTTETQTTAPSPCGAIPSIAQAYSLNLTVVPHPFGTPVNYVTMWPAGVTTPTVSTLNDSQGAVTANAAIVPAGTPSGGINVFAYGPADVIIDMNGFYAAPTDLNSNTAIGAGTLLSNTTGGQNTAVGQSALSANTSGNYNTAVGLDALQQNTIGAANTANGNAALGNNTTGGQNTASGQAALLYNSIGSNNTAHGFQALIDNSTGNNNTAVGAGAGFTATTTNANVSGSNNTYVGYQCGANTSAQLDNSFCLGAGALFGASNTGVLGNASVTDVFFGGATAQAVAHALGVSLTGSSTGVTKLVSSNSSATNYTITVPNPSGSNDALCLQTLANCSTGGSGPAGGVLSGTYPNPGFAPIAAGTFLGNFTGSSGPPVATSLAVAKLCTWVSSPLASAVRIDNGTGCAVDSLATYTSSGLNIPSGTAYLYGGTQIAMAQLGSSNFYFGNAGNLTGTGTGNTATGSQALRNNNTGNYNVADGYGALQNNITGYSNTASGFNALSANTTGGSNTASGYSALNANLNGSGNTATGSNALGANTTGNDNTANGWYALSANLNGAFNMASGSSALNANITGSYNTASGSLALYENTTGSNNAANGSSALQNNIGSYNTATGSGALALSTTGSYNTAIGFQAGFNATTGSNNIHIGNQGATADNGVIRIGTQGTQTLTAIAGIYGGTPNTPNLLVCVDANGTLGTSGCTNTPSSQRFKEQIAEMGDSSSKLLQLRPVTFLYKPEYDDGSRSLQYGLIAEEVAKLYPEMVGYGKDGQPNSVKYQSLAPMLLNEVQKLAAQNQSQAAENKKLEDRLAALEALLTGTTVTKAGGSQ